MEKVEIFELCQKEMGVDSTIFVTSWKEIQAYSHANIYTHRKWIELDQNLLFNSIDSNINC